MQRFRRVARWDRTTPPPEIGRIIRITSTAPYRTVTDHGDACTVVSTYEQAGDLYVVTSLTARAND